MLKSFVLWLAGRTILEVIQDCCGLQLVNICVGQPSSGNKKQSNKQPAILFSTRFRRLFLVSNSKMILLILIQEKSKLKMIQVIKLYLSLQRAKKIGMLNKYSILRIERSLPYSNTWFCMITLQINIAQDMSSQKMVMQQFLMILTRLHYSKKDHINFLSLSVLLAKMQKTTLAAAMMITPRMASTTMVTPIIDLNCSLELRIPYIRFKISNIFCFCLYIHYTSLFRFSLSLRSGRQSKLASSNLVCISMRTLIGLGSEVETQKVQVFELSAILLIVYEILLPILVATSFQPFLYALSWFITSMRKLVVSASILNKYFSSFSVVMGWVTQHFIEADWSLIAIQCHFQPHAENCAHAPAGKQKRFKGHLLSQKIRFEIIKHILLPTSAIKKHLKRYQVTSEEPSDLCSIY